MGHRYHFTRDWFSSSIDQWRCLLAPIAGSPGLRFLEVGVYEGRATVWLLRNVLGHPSARLDCVDPFEWRVRDGRPAQSQMQDVKRRFHRNVEATGAPHKVRLIEARSEDALCTLPARSYDCVYLDGSHRSADVLSDAVLAFRLLKPSALLLFDDYGLAASRGIPESLDDPKAGIDAFLHVYARRVEVVSAGYQVAIRRRRGDERVR